MIPVDSTPEQAAYWADRDGVQVIPHIIGGPEEGPNVIPCPALVGQITVRRDDGSTINGRVFHVAYELDEIELAHLARGGQLWLTTWGGLPIHHLEVVEP